MLAKAVATEAGANFINISMSSITSKVISRDTMNFAECYGCLALKLSIDHTSVLAVVWRRREICEGSFLSGQ